MLRSPASDAELFDQIPPTPFRFSYLFQPQAACLQPISVLPPTLSYWLVCSCVRAVGKTQVVPDLAGSETSTGINCSRHLQRSFEDFVGSFLHGYLPPTFLRQV